MACKRSIDCTCEECAAANAAFSVDDLKQFSSKIDYGEGEQIDDSNPPDTKPPVRSSPKRAPRRRLKQRPAPAVPIEESAPVAAPRDGDNAPPAPQALASANIEQASAPPASPAPTVGGGGVDPDSGPLDVRLVSKDWKVRKAAYQQVQTLFQQAPSEDSDVFLLYASFLKGMVQDSNASCLDVALDTLLAFAGNYINASEYAADLAPGVVAKGLSGRPGTITRAEEALLKLMEVDTPNVVVGVLLEGLSDKKPKVPPACVAIMTKALELFGARAMPIKEMKSALPGMLAHKVVPVRQQGLALTAEIISWCGEALLASVISELRSAQKTELDNMVADKNKGSPRVPTRYLRKDRPTACEGAEERPQSQATAAFDPREFLEPVDILSKLPKTEFNQKLAATKWSEILEGLNIAIDLIGAVPKLTPGDYGDLVQKVKRLGDHSHVQVASTAHRLLSLLAEGLGFGFQPYCKSIIGAMLLKLRDKKCVAVLGTCLDKVYGNPHSLDQVVEELVPALDSKKSIHARLAALEWISRCVSRKKPPIETTTLVTLARTTVRLVDDSDPKIRDAACTTLAAVSNASRGKNGPVWAVVMELQNNNARAFKKIQAQVDGDSGTDATAPTQPVRKGASSSGQGVSSRRGSPVSSDSTTSGSRTEKERGKPSGPNLSSAGARAGPRGNGKALNQRPVSVSKSTGAKKQAAAPAEVNDDVDDTSVSMTAEEAMDTLASSGIEGWEDSVSPGLRGAAWKAKVGAIHDIAQAAQSDPAQMLTPVVVVFAAHTKQFKDSNFNVLKAAFLGIKSLLEAAHSTSGSRGNPAALATVLPPAVEKLSDRKLQETTSSLLTTASEAFGPSWVSRRLMKAAREAKAPLVHSEALTWLKRCVEDFGARVLPARQVITFAVSELEHVNPKVRSSALELLSSMYHRLGPPMKALLPELRSAIQSQVDDAFTAIGHDPSADSQTSRRVLPADGVEQDAGDGSCDGLPRTDLSILVEKDCLSRMQCTKGKYAWKGRKSAMEEVVQACAKSGNHIEANKFAVEVLKALTPRLADSQSNLKPLAAGALSEVVSSVGPDASAKLARIYAEPLLTCVSDNRKIMRDAAVAALQKVTSSGGALHVPTVEALMAPVVAVMVNTVGRFELLSWLKPLMSHLPAGEVPTSLVSPLLGCMQDKSSGVRQLAQDCLSELLSTGTVKPARVHAATRDFQPAVLRSLKPMLEKILDNAAASSGNSGPRDVAASNTAPQVAPTSEVSKLMRSGASAAAAPARGKHTSRSNIHIRPLKADGTSESERSNATTQSPLLSTNSKAKRFESEKRSRWFVSSDEPRDHQTASLKALWSPLLRPDACDILFPAKAGSMECGTTGVELLSRALRDQRSSFMDQLDLILKWVSLRLCEKENVRAMGQLLQFMRDTFHALVETEYRLEDIEIDAFVPILLEKSGQSKERFRMAIRELLAKLPALCSYPKYSRLLLQATSSKNSRTRVACLLELSRCIAEEGPANAVGKKGLKELAKHVDSDQAEVRSAALDAVESCYIALGMDPSRIHRLLGPFNDKAKSLVDERMKAIDRKGGKIHAEAGQPDTRSTAETGAPVECPPEHSSSIAEQPGSLAASAEESPLSVTSDKSGMEVLALSTCGATPAVMEEVEVQLELSEVHRPSLGGLKAEYRMDRLPLGSGSSTQGGGEEGPFRFDCDELEVKLSPRSRQREAGNAASNATLEAILSEVGTNAKSGLFEKNAPDELGHMDVKYVVKQLKEVIRARLVTRLEKCLLHYNTLWVIPSDERERAVNQIKGLSSWATAEVQRMGGEGILAQQHSRLISMLVRCMRLSFTGAPAVAEEDRQYATVPGTGGIDVDLALQVVTALDDVCNISSRSFELPSLTAVLREVCLWLVERRIGPQALHEKYRECDPYAQVQQKLNRVATSSGSATLSVGIAAMLEVVAEVQEKRAKRNNEPEQVEVNQKDSVEAKLLRVYVKLLARLLVNSDHNKFGINHGINDGSDDGTTDDTKADYLEQIGGLSPPLILRSLHKYFMSEHARESLELDVDEHKAYDDVKRLVVTLCERLCSVCGSSALVSAAAKIRTEDRNGGEENRAIAEAWSSLLNRCLVTSKENHEDLGRRHSSPVPAVNSDHVAEIARLIGLVSAESQSVHSGGDDASNALTELKDYLQRWPEALVTLKDQVHRLKPRFRQFILDRCTRSHHSEAGIRNTPLRGRMTDVHGSWSARRGQELENSRRSLTLDSSEPVPRPIGVADIHIEEGTFQSRNRLQEIRRRMGGMGARESAMGSGGPLQYPLPGVASSRGHQADEMADRPLSLRQTSGSTSDLQARLRRPAGGRGAVDSTSSLAERFRKRNK